MSRAKAWAGRMLAVGVLLAAAGERPAAQAPVRGSTLAGTVVDAESARGLPGVTVVLEPASAGVLPSRRRGDSPFLQATRSATTSESGEYSFAEVAPGVYRLRFSRMGYRVAGVQVELRGTGGSRVSVGLEVEPVLLEPLTVTTPGANPFGRPSSAPAGEPRLAAERLRQERYLSSDVRGITQPDLVESVTLAETDLFRSLQRLPGVSGRDVWSAEVWTRGAPWDQTRVYFDGLPLFHPLHGFGAFSGVNADAVGAAFLHPGVQPAGLGGGAAGAVDLRSRRAGGAGALQGTGELSLVSARLALERQSDSSRVAWMIAGRRSYVDLVTRAIDGLTGGEDFYLPYSFYDLTVRTDYRLGRQSALEVSTLLNVDQITGTIPDVLHRSRAHWGGGAARATLVAPLFGLDSRHTLGFSGFGSRSERAPADSARERSYAAGSVDPTANDLWYLSLLGDFRPASGAEWRVGYELVGEEVLYWGPRPFRYRAPRPVSTRWNDQLVRGALWAERRWRPSERLVVDGGLRLEAGPSVRGGGTLRPAPRLSARYQLSPEIGVSAGAGRTFQYEQTLAPGGVTPTNGLYSEYLWTLAGDTVPVLRSDVGSLGAEWWLSPQWLGSANVYLRRTDGLLMPNPRPGDLTTDPAVFAVGQSRGQGLELSLRRLAGRWTASAAYTYARTEMEAAGLRFPAPGDRRHELDATAMVRLGRAWRVGGAYSAASGAPFTRMIEGWPECQRYDPEIRDYVHLPECRWLRTPRAEDPGAERGSASQRLDLLLSWTRAFRSSEMSVFLQLHNALNWKWEETGGYTRSYPMCEGYSGGQLHSCPQTIDEFLPGAPILPVFGVRVTF